MALLEQIVRPFQAPDSLIKRLNSTLVVQAPSGIPTLAWGAAGTAPTPFAVSFTVTGPINQFYEIDRQVTPVRIQNPDDSTQYVIAQRVDSVTFKKKSGSLSSPTQESGDNVSGTSGGAPTNTGYSSNNPNPSTQTNPLTSPAAPTQTTQEQDGYSLNQSASPSETPVGPQQDITSG